MRDTPERDLAVANELGRMAGVRIKELESERDQLLAEVARLREALKPFAELITEIEAVKVKPKDGYLSLCQFYNDGSSWNYGHIDLGDLRNAREARRRSGPHD